MTDTLTVILVEDDALTVSLEEEVLSVTIVEEALVVNITEVIDLSGGGDHTLLQNLDTIDQHPMNVIIGLEDVLLAKDTALAAHVAAADPHTVYVLESLLDSLVTVIIAANPIVGANTAKETNVPTELEVGTVNTNTVSITSDGSVDDVTLPAATNATAGVATAVQIIKLEGVETGATGDQTASEVPFTPGGDLSATDVQAALDELNDEKQPLDAKLTDIVDGNPAIGDFYVWDGAHIVPTIPSTFGQMILSQGPGSFPIWRDRMIVDVENGLWINEATNGPLLGLDLATNSSPGAASAAHITELESIMAFLSNGLYYKQSFIDGDLTAGILTVGHSLNSEFPSAVTVWDNNGKIVTPDDVTSTGVNTLTVDLSSYGTITGTWNVSIIY